MDHNYSEKVYNDIMGKTDSWLADFKESQYFNKLTNSQKEEAEFIIKKFTEMTYIYQLRRPREWTSDSLIYVLHDLFPSKITTNKLFLKKVEPVLSHYFLFLDEIGQLKNSAALSKTLVEVAPLMIENVNNNLK